MLQHAIRAVLAVWPLAQLGNLELAKQQGRLVAALKAGADVMKELQAQVSVEDVKQLMEDSAQAKAYQVHGRICMPGRACVAAHYVCGKKPTMAIRCCHMLTCTWQSQRALP
jgi:hypothetical protein